jgi:protein phosphatase
VALSEKECQDCGTVTGTVWWAIILRDVGQEGTPQSGGYLDKQRRYQLLETLPPQQKTATTTEVQVRVLDCQPFQPSLLQVGVQEGMAMEIPELAKTYLALQPQFYHQLPAIHDAWQQDGEQVVLIADRYDWPKLMDMWQDDKTTPLQILHWLYEMIQLWAVLEPWHCRQSLLELSNLRVDKDGVLGLQRLYAEIEAGQPLTLQDLGLVWQRFFQESQRTQFGSLVELLTDLKAGDIQTIEDLRSRLEEISNKVQASVTSTSDQTPETAAVEPASAATPESQKLDEPQDSLSKSDDMPTLMLPMQLSSLEDAGLTDVGRQRDRNEDFFGIETVINKLEFPNGQAVQAHGLYILCDGMGGHARGEVASTLAVKTLQQYFKNYWQPYASLPTEDSIREAVLLANQAIYELNQQDARSGIGRMGTTLVMVLIHNTQVAVAHVGDSRLYRLSHKRGLEQVSVDHEVGQREILQGIEPAIAYARSDAYQLTQALGPRDENFVDPDVQFLELNQDTLLILASDGLTDNNLLEEHWQTHLEPLLSSKASLERGVSDLIDLANQYNGHDNITAVVIRAKVRANLEI